MYIKRDNYLKDLVSSLNTKLIKVIVGPRRVGKSFLLYNIFKNYLIENGVRDDHIIELKLDILSNAKYRNLYEFVKYFKERIIYDGKTNYLLIDEIQNLKSMKNKDVEGNILTFYDALMELNDIKNVQIFVTGSNSHMLSSEIATEFRGRNYNIEVFPLSFKEYYDCYKNMFNNDIEKIYQYYIRYGGLPLTLELNSENEKREYLTDIYKTIYIKDIIENNKIRKNSTFLLTLINYLANNVGTLFNTLKLENIFKSKEHIEVSSPTISSYLKKIEEAYIFRSVEIKDLKGKKILGTNKKIYFNDLGIRYAANNFNNFTQEPHYMENVIYNELIKRKYNVFIGNIVKNEFINSKQVKKTYEVDFIIEKNGLTYYLQSAFFIDNEEKRKQEKNSLLKINDNFKKIIITKVNSGNYYDEDGILYLNLYDFLLDEDIFNKY